MAESENLFHAARMPFPAEQGPLALTLLRRAPPPGFRIPGRPGEPAIAHDTSRTGESPAGRASAWP